jgi:hypothetical protein
MNTAISPDAVNRVSQNLGQAELEMRLESNDWAHTPGIVSWALNGYRDAKRIDAPVGPFLAVLAYGYDLGAVIAERVLRGDILHRVEGDEVVISLTELDCVTYEGRHTRVDRRNDDELHF